MTRSVPVVLASSKGPPPELSARILNAAVALMGRAGRTGTVRVEGASMTPTLRAGDHLSVDFAPRRIRFGDILVFRQGDYLVVHRLVGRAPAEGGSPVRTRGDALSSLDRPLDPADVVGRVTAVRREGRWYDLNAAGARLYARALGTHDLFWALAAAAAGRAERLAARLGVRVSLRHGVTVLDAGFLRRADRWIFPRLHRIGAPPRVGSGGAPEGPG